jgi:hypothetical protein
MASRPRHYAGEQLHRRRVVSPPHVKLLLQQVVPRVTAAFQSLLLSRRNLNVEALFLQRLINRGGLPETREFSFCDGSDDLQLHSVPGKDFVPCAPY